MDRTGRAKRLAVSTADTLDAVWFFPDGNVHLAHLLAAFAVDTFVLIHRQAVECHRIKQPVNSSQRTEIFAERALVFD